MATRNRENVDRNIIAAKRMRDGGDKLVEIGRKLGKHHSTVIYYLQRYGELYAFNKQFRDKVNENNRAI